MDKKIPGAEYTPEALALQDKIRLSEAKMRVDKLELRKINLKMELEKVDYEILLQEETLKELENGETGKEGK